MMRARLLFVFLCDAFDGQYHSVLRPLHCPADDDSVWVEILLVFARFLAA